MDVAKELCTDVHLTLTAGVYFKAHVFREYWRSGLLAEALSLATIECQTEFLLCFKWCSTLRGSSAALTVQAAPTVAGGSVAISAGAVSTGTTALALEDSLPQALPWNQHLVEMTVCHDSCSKSKDGICDDGRSEDGQERLCLLFLYSQPALAL